MSIDKSKKFLLDFHSQFPSCTPIAFQHGKTSEGTTSYDKLATLAQNAQTVLDLACGDGFLIKKVWDLNPRADITGIDMSPSELEIAQSSLSSAQVHFIQGEVQSLPLTSNSVDVTLCHMALMLMDDIEEVISEIHRCLKPQGVFSAVLSGQFELSAAHQVYLKLLDQSLLSEGKTRDLKLGDPRVLQAHTLSSFFSPSLLSPPEIKEFKIEFYEEPVNLMSFFMMLYNVGLLSEKGQQDLSRDLLQQLNSMADFSGRIHHFMWLRQITCIKK